MSGQTQNTGNGMSYDFGIQIARATVTSLATTVAGVIALTGSIAGLVDASRQMEIRLNANHVALGGYANTIKTIAFAQQQVLKDGRFVTDSIVEGFRELNRAGIDARKNFDFVAKIAESVNADFKDIAKTIRTGDYNALAEMGVITDRMARSYEAMGFTQAQNVRNVMALLKQANGKKMFDGAIPTLDSIKRRLSGFKGLFVQSIVGDPRDPEGLGSTVKRALTSIANLLERNKNRIIYYGKIVGAVLKTTFNVIGDFVKYIARSVGLVEKASDMSARTMQDRLMSFGLWLEIQRVRIKIFFEEYGKYIGWIIKLFATYKALQFAGNIWRNLLGGAVRYFTYLKDAGGAVSQKLFDITNLFRVIVSQAWAFTAAMLANPIGLIVIAAVALATAIYLIYKNWTAVFGQMQKVNDVAMGMLGIFNPILATVGFILKYFYEIKAIINNLSITATNWIQGMWYRLQSFLIETKKVFVEVGKFLASVFQPVIDAIRPVIDFLDKYLWQPMKTFFSWINGVSGNIIGKILGKGVTNTNTAAQNSGSDAKYRLNKLLMEGGISADEWRKQTKQIDDRTAGASTNTTVAAQKAGALAGKPVAKSVNYDPPAIPESTSGGATVSNSYASGAIQINIPPGTQIDEKKLAKMIDEILIKKSAVKNLREGN